MFNKNRIIPSNVSRVAIDFRQLENTSRNSELIMIVQSKYIIVPVVPFRIHETLNLNLYERENPTLSLTAAHALYLQMLRLFIKTGSSYHSTYTVMLVDKLAKQ